MDIPAQIAAVEREVHGRDLVIRRPYVADVADVWDACTNPERIRQWFLPVTGDLRRGGRYQLRDNAGGEILACEPPHLLRISWVFGAAPPSYVQVWLGALDGGTLFELRHWGVDDPAHWAQFGPGAAGVGWDLTVLGLGLHLAGLVNPQGWGESPEAAEYMLASAAAWGAAHAASGEAPVAAMTAADRTAAFYVPPE